MISTLQSKPYIAGVLQTHSRYSFGLSKSGAQIYPFKPFEQGLPLFLVASKCMDKVKVCDKNKNQYAMIRYLEWKGKYPRGSCERVFGSVDSIEAMFSCLPYVYSLVTIHPKFKIKRKRVFKRQMDKLIVDALSKTDTTAYRKLDPLLPIISVDPVGCIDIDDALSFEELDDGMVRIGVHIADISLYLNSLHIHYPDWKLYDRVANSLQSIYTPLKQFPMLPENLAFHYASLREGEESYAMTVWLLYEPSADGCLHLIPKGSYVEKTIIVNMKAFSYEEANELYHKSKTTKMASATSSTIEQLIDSSSSIAKKYLPILWQKNKIWNSHNMIETFMIIANQFVGTYLMKNSNPSTPLIFRTHTKPLTILQEGPYLEDGSTASFSTCSSKQSSTLLSFLNIYHSSAANYTIGSSSKKQTVASVYSHYGLRLENYTHFTSPIRRFPDIYTHLIIKRYIMKDTSVQPSIDYFHPDKLVECIQNINCAQKQVKQLDRMIQRIELMRMIEEEHGGVYQTKCIVFGFSEEQPFKVIVYLPEKKLLLPIYLIHKEIQAQFQWNLEGGNAAYITKQDTFEVLRFDLYQEIEIEMRSRRSKSGFWEKILVRY